MEDKKKGFLKLEDYGVINISGGTKQELIDLLIDHELNLFMPNIYDLCRERTGGNQLCEEIKH